MTYLQQSTNDCTSLGICQSRLEVIYRPAHALQAKLRNGGEIGLAGCHLHRGGTATV